MIDDTLLEAEEKMEKAVAVAKEEFSGIRTGRAHPSMFNKITAEYYGTQTPVNQLASFHMPEPRMVIVQPFDKSLDGRIEKAIRNSDLGVNPSNDGVDHPGDLPRALRGAQARSSSRSPGTRPRTAGSPSATSAGTPRTRSTSWSRAARRARTTAAGPSVSSTTSPTPTSTQVDELLKHKEAELLEV